MADNNKNIFGNVTNTIINGLQGPYVVILVVAVISGMLGVIFILNQIIAIILILVPKY